MKKRKDGRYQVAVSDLNGKRHFVYGRTIKETEAKAAELRTQLNGGVALEKNITVAELAELWSRLDKEPELKPQSFYALQVAIRAMNSCIGSVHVRDLTAAHVEMMRKQFVAEGKYVTFNKILTALRSMLDFGIRHDYVIRNVTAGIKTVKELPKVTKRALTPFELRAIEGADLAPQDRLMVDLLRFSGMRRGEMLALDVGDIDLNRHEVVVSKMLVARTNEVEEGSKTAAGTRIVPLPQIFFDRNEAYLRSRHPAEPLLMTSTYKRIHAATFTQRWKKVMKQIFGDDVPEVMTAHILRHNYASELYQSGLMKEDLKAAQYILGHADVHTTMNTYTHFTEKQLDRSRIDAFYKSDVKMMSESENGRKKMA